MRSKFLGAAFRFQDQLRQIVAVAATDQWKADKLAKAEVSRKSANSTIRNE